MFVVFAFSLTREGSNSDASFAGCSRSSPRKCRTPISGVFAVLVSAGRCSTLGVGQTPVVSLRLHQEWQQDIDEWRSGEPDHLSRSDAIRTLLGMGTSLRRTLGVRGVRNYREMPNTPPNSRP